MAPARLAPLVAAALALAPGMASAGVPVVIYPFKVPGLSPTQRADLHGMLAAGLASATRRGVLSPRSPVLTPSTCGDAPAPACLAAVAGAGLVFSGRGELRSGVVLVTAALWDGKGTRTREVRFVVDLVIENLRPIGDALLELAVEIAPDGSIARDDAPKVPDRQAGPPQTLAPTLAGAPLPPPASTTATSTPAHPERSAAAGGAESKGTSTATTRPGRVPLAAPAPRAPPHWRRTAGPWLTAIGLGLLGGGATVGYLNRDVARDLDGRYARGELTAADRASYDRVQTYNVLSSALFAAGATATAWGTCLWISAPAAPGGPVAVGAGGRF
jgi:hypothetical protein